MPRRRAIAVLGALACVLGPAAAFAASTVSAAKANEPLAPVHMSISIDSFQTIQGAWIELIYREAFRRIGLAMHLHMVPSKRGTAMLDSGQIDGELHRVVSYGDGHPQRLLVPEPHFFASITAYGLAGIALPNGWQALANTPYRVEYRAGSVLAERELQKQVPAPQLSAINTAQLGLRKLAARRTDLYVDIDMVVDTALATPEFRARGIRPIAIMSKVSGHAYLHSRHARLVPQLSAALADMKKEGLVEKYRAQAFSMAPPRAPGLESPATMAHY